MIVKIVNNLDKISPYSFLSGSVASGAGTFPVKNINTFSANWAIQFGATKEEKSEILVISASAPSGTALVTTGTARFDHPEDTLVYATHYDQVIFKRSTSGTAGTATAMTNGTVTITPDSQYTQFDDTSGATTYAYKAQFVNSVSGDLSSESDWLTPSGYTFYSKYSLRERTKNKLFSANYIKNNDMVDEWINEWLETMNNTAVEVNEDYNIGTVNVSFGTNGLGTITSADFKEIRKLDVTTDGANYYRAVRIKTIDFGPQETFESTNPYFYMEGDTVFAVKNGDTAGTARIVYYRLGTTLANETDELPTVMKGYTKSFTDYCLSQSYYLDNKVELGDRFSTFAQAGKESFKLEITPRGKTGPQFIPLVDPISGDDFYGYL